MFDWRAKAGRYFAHAQDYLNLCILRMLESTFSLDAAHMRELKKKKKEKKKDFTILKVNLEIPGKALSMHGIRAE